MSSATLPLLRGNITLSDALTEENDILLRLTYPDKRLQFCQELYSHTREIEAIASHHLRVPREACRVPWADEWLHGSCNICLPVYVHEKKTCMIRFPLPYRVGEASYPGNAEEKLRCEVATYIWIRSNCPDVPIPRLWGFGFPGGPNFTAIDRTSFASRLFWRVRCYFHWILGKPAPIDYKIHPHRQDFHQGYMLIEFIERGRMLSSTWKTDRHDAAKRMALFRDLSRIMLSLAKVEFPRIGSLRLSNDGVVSLTNRPLSIQVHELENQGIPTNIPRNMTYTTTESYLLDALACHDNRIRFQGNSIADAVDGKEQLSALAVMRTIMVDFANRDQRNGPFYLMLTDVHQSNIFVDDNWRITSLIDLEWACVQPAEMLSPPYWLADSAIDMITGENLVAFEALHGEFLTAFEETELLLRHGATAFSLGMRRGWRSGGFWYFYAIQSFTGLYNLFYQHVWPIYATNAVRRGEQIDPSVAQYWTRKVDDFVDRKLADKARYEVLVRAAFEDALRIEDRN